MDREYTLDLQDILCPMNASGSLVPMDFLLEVDLDWLCIAAEIAACLLIFSLAWRPAKASSKGAVAVVSTVDWEPLQCSIAHAVTATGRSLSLRSNATDEERLRELQTIVPTPYRDRLTGTWNANGMDRLIQEWHCEAEPHAYPSCYASISLSNVDELMEQRGAACVEAAVRTVSEYLTESLGNCAVISRYQPSRFLLQIFGKTLSECQDVISKLMQSIESPEFFSFHDEPVPLASENQFWFSNRGVGPEELIQILEDGGQESPSVTDAVPHTHHDEAASEPEPEVEKPFSIDSLAPFPCPWDDDPEKPVPAEEPGKEIEVAPATETDSVQGGATQRFTEGASTQKVEGFASPEQIEELLSQLNDDGDSNLGDDAQMLVANEEDKHEEGVRLTASEAETESHSSSRLIDVIEEEDGESEKPAETPAEMPAPAPESPKSSSIYTDDIEESLINDDLASLFAAVRSSAVGDFGYADNKGPQSGGDRAEPKVPGKNLGPDQTSS